MGSGAAGPLLLGSRNLPVARSAAEEWATAERRPSLGSVVHASRSAQALARLSTCWARAVRAHPRCILACGLLVAVVAAGCNLVHPTDATLLQAWLPGGWREHDRHTAENAWGAQRLDQIIIRPLKGRHWTTARPHESKKELQAALSFLHALSTTSQTDFGDRTEYKDVCFQPAQPYAPGCLIYSPLAWWGGNEGKFVSDVDIWSTLRAPDAKGGVRGLSVKRSDVLSIVEDNDGGVIEVNALMLWLFVDVAPSRATPAYIAKAASFEHALLRSCAQARTNASLPFEAYCSISTSVQQEIQSSAESDVAVVVMTVGALFCFHLVVLCAMDLKNWALNSISACTTGMTLTGVFGCMRACGSFGLITPYPIQAMMLFLPLTMGLHHRVLIAGQCRCVITKTSDQQSTLVDPQRLLEVLAINILTPAACTMTAAAAGMICASVWILQVPAIQGCAIVGAGGVLLDWVLLATVYLPAVALCQERQRHTDIDTACGMQSVWFEKGHGRTPALTPSFRTEQVKRRVGLASTVPKKCCQTREQVQAGCLSCYRLLACCGAVTLLTLSAPYARAFVYMDSGGLLHLNVTTQSLVPINSEIRNWADNYANYFAPAVSLPIDFPIVVGDGTPAALMDPSNGPSLVAAAEVLRKDPRLNASTVTDWYGTFRAWCHKSYDGLHLCRDTMQGGDPETGAVGYLTQKSFSKYLSLFIADHEEIAADMKMDGPLFSLKLRAAKFSAATPRGAVQAYTVQRDLPSAMHTLAKRAFSVNAARTHAGKGGDQHRLTHALTAISYSPAFPFFELWEPANCDLVVLGVLQLVASTAVCVLVLGLWQATMVLLCVLATVSTMFLALDEVFQQDLNMVTAVNCMIFIPVGIDLFFHLGFRATALSCLYYRDRKSLNGGGSAHLQVPYSYRTSDVDDYEHAMHSAHLVAVVVLPATIAFAVTVGFPLWLLLLCRSPLNSLFAYLYQTMLIIQACFGLLVRSHRFANGNSRTTCLLWHLSPSPPCVVPSTVAVGSTFCTAVGNCGWLVCLSSGVVATAGAERIHLVARAASAHGLVWREGIVEDSSQPDMRLDCGTRERDFGVQYGVPTRVVAGGNRRPRDTLALSLNLN